MKIGEDLEFQADTCIFLKVGVVFVALGFRKDADFFKKSIAQKHPFLKNIDTFVPEQVSFQGSFLFNPTLNCISHESFLSEIQALGAVLYLALNAGRVPTFNAFFISKKLVHHLKFDFHEKSRIQNTPSGTRFVGICSIWVWRDGIVCANRQPNCCECQCQLGVA